MLLNDILNRVLIIDDKENEIEKLREVLIADDISVDYSKPDIPHDFQFKRNRQLIFMDLMLDGIVNNLKTNVSRIISILRNNLSQDFGLYGLVVWTSHHEEVEGLKEALGRAYKQDMENANMSDEEIASADFESVTFNNSPIVPPLFVVSLDKTEYIDKGYDNLLLDLSDRINNDTSAYFFTSWYESVINGVGKSINDIYSLAPEYPKRKEELTYLLYRMGMNHIGIGKRNAPQYDKISEDTYKAFDELLIADVNSSRRYEKALYITTPTKPWASQINKKLEISAKLNRKLFVDADNISDNEIVPGNIYIVKNDQSPLIVDLKPKDLDDFHLEYTNIAIELTPPCDFSNKKAGSRLIGGFAFEMIKEPVRDTIERLERVLGADRLYTLWLTMIGEKIMVLCFDFRYLYTPSEIDLKKKELYEVWFRARPRLFADILQKFSSHAARLGLSNIDLMK